MKIGFAMRRPIKWIESGNVQVPVVLGEFTVETKKTWERHPIEFEYKRVFSYKEAKELVKQGFLDYGISEPLFDTLAILERNSTFNSVIKEWRHKYSIPEDLAYPEYRELEATRSKEWKKDIVAEMFRFSSEYKMPFLLNKGSIFQLLFTSTLEYFSDDLAMICIGEAPVACESIPIRLLSRDITISQIHQFIDNHQGEIRRAIKHLRKQPLVHTRELKRNLRIYDLKKANPLLSWGKLTDIISQEFPSDQNANEANIRVAYRRVEKLIESHFSKRKKPLHLTPRTFLADKWEDVV